MPSSIDLANWMGSVQGSKKLSELSIPGTHDSGSRYIDPVAHPLNVSPRLTAQTAGIREQLDAGIRFLDIRVGYTNGDFHLYHESVSLNLEFGDDVQAVCKSFLDAHPTETIILSLKKEDDAPTGGNGNVTFQSRFDTYVREHANLWYLGNTIPDLHNVRQQIVLFRRFELDRAPASQTLGINAFDGFPNDGTASFGSAATAKLKVQDKFGQTEADETKAAKLTAVQDLLNEASGTGGDSDTLYVSFASAAGVVPVDFPLSVANYINPRLLTYFNGKRGRFGIVPMDFQTSELNRLIVQTNPTK